MIGYCILAIIILWLVVILLRAVTFKPKTEKKVETIDVKINEEKVIQDMSDMIKCKTVSYRDDNLIDEDEFQKFRDLLQERFPLVHQKCTLEHLGKNGLLYYLKGESSKKPSVCMAHYDVVPVNEEKWTKPAFEGLIEGGFIWGRGTLDTKGTLCGVMEALEFLLKQNYVPKNDLYLSFSGQEEIDGPTCAEIVKYLQTKGVKPAIVLDEGGAVVEKALPGLEHECAMVGTAEKGSVNLDFIIEGAGGHASAPPTHTHIGELAAAVQAVENHPFKPHYTNPFLEMFDTLGRYSKFGYRLIFANLWCFKPILNAVCKKTGGELNALIRTTCAFTRASGSDAYNVLPPKSSVGMNMRVIQGDTIESTTKYLNKIIHNDKIKISLVNGMNPSICSDTSCAEWQLLKDAIKETWSDVIVSPYLMMACSDSRHYCRITDHVFRFSAMKLTNEERKMIHGNDERVPIETMIKTVKFYVRFLRKI
ncbi:MAG: peptidase M20 [Treponema sp. CETP13]|nr:MAG: peptidase M20 [Treponema sp. CETP13]